MRDIGILSELGRQVAEVAHLPAQAENRRRWVLSNGLRQERPMVLFDQLPWHELGDGGELTLRCETPFCREMEQSLRRTLFQWRHFPADMVVDPFVRVPMVVDGLHLGLQIRETTSALDADNDVTGHHYENQLVTPEDIEKLQMPRVSLNEAETRQREAMAHEAFDGILPVYMSGVTLSCALWDRLVELMGTDTLFFDMIDRPEFIHAIMRRMVDIYMAILDQLEAQNLLDARQSIIHSSGAYTDELPKEGFRPDHIRAGDVWGRGMAQILSSVSLEMHEEFEMEHVRPLYARFCLVYYGCCEPLDRKMSLVRTLPNVRKVSISPWADAGIAAGAIGADYVYSGKVNPAFLAGEAFELEGMLADARRHVDACRAEGCQLELIVKDISTVRGDVGRLSRIERELMALVGA